MTTAEYIQLMNEAKKLGISAMKVGDLEIAFAQELKLSQHPRQDELLPMPSMDDVFREMQNRLVQTGQSSDGEQPTLTDVKATMPLEDPSQDLGDSALFEVTK